MIKKIISEQLLSECPNCGAPRVGNETNCPYCGTAMTVRSVDTWNLSSADIVELAQILEPEELAEMMKENNKAIREKLMRRKRTEIVATLRPTTWRSGRSNAKLIAAALCFAVVVFLVNYLASPNAGHTYDNSNDHAYDYYAYNPGYLGFYAEVPTEEPTTGADIGADVGAVFFFTIVMVFAGVALIAWTAVSVKRYRNVLRYGKKYTAEVVMTGDELRGIYGAFDAAIGSRLPMKVKLEMNGRPTVMLIAGPTGTEIGEKITILGYGNDFVVAPGNAA